MTRIALLAGYIADKATQARKIVQWTHIEPLMSKTSILFHLGLRLLDGKATGKRMLEYLYEIQAGAFLVGAIEDNEIKKILSQRTVNGKPKRRKNYGFDTRAVAHIDILCDEIIRLVCQYGQVSADSDKEPADSTD